MRVNRKAPPHFQTPGSNNAVFETWIDDPTNFPKEPEKAHPPRWPDRPYTREAQLRSLVEASQPRFHHVHCGSRPAPPAPGHPRPSRRRW